MTRTSTRTCTAPVRPHVAVAGATFAVLAASALLVGVNAAPKTALALDETTGWSPEVACAACHSSQDASASEGTHGVLGCVACHVDEGLAAVHEDAAEPPSTTLRRLKATAVADDVCLGCHGDGMPFAPVSEGDDKDSADKQDATQKEANADDKAATSDAAKDEGAQENAQEADGAAAADGEGAEETAIGRTALAAATATCEALTDTKGTTVNPHDLPDVAEHQSIGCVNCHKGHADADPAETAPTQCTSCHHAGVYECNTCHAADDFA